MQKLVLASSNKGKISELQALLSPYQLQVVPQQELGVTDADETGLTFVENAILKARHAALATGLPAIADDSGLAVDAIGGEPGIYSARYSGEAATDAENISKLLHALQQVPPANRSAQFHCVLVYLRHASDPTPLVCHGVWSGTISEQVQGSAGFGYDPVFIPTGDTLSAAELSKEQKAAISHRGLALRQLVAQMQRLSTEQQG
ncbi:MULTISPECIES: RdgB/HAM1 family non-canonical purine NTP pyrophosphatase [unclassified Arsukibacterium]|uniref:RdgB/HAM1 family non-canonical purine NTP pyrophosphatase n=1 Tax=unclassified Arsukibacterium TaxID=2635278 RepID=UPI000C3C0162|nr:MULTISPECIES: RdgB/HAM1 family non-canonical purine NTP pyrophosphatase [unclassified Arsukibacterium]MAA96590.1 non-canonical purine NTP pyrophosphatase, RdgB/HAM1 family [Rheinheimera sp.]MBM35277.1 non-canonical purine NTP pyrophosphatase, RdgB/HAM1 family [Rheinheimera sp.]HAW91902.1 non-canonical purine NTP pyrophosphatase, RdgB/HAM1 family [Candidatus Azambacteria bacterium]|tara:strand:+ start:63600 stop:64211 length:612 start_codon:yes stop_codon:yes gene_type:complete